MKTLTHKIKTLLPFIVISILACCAYAPSLRAPFVFDDYSNIVYNPDIKHIGNLKSRLFYPMPHIEANRNLSTRPLLFLTLTLNYAVSGMDPLGYHLFNLLLHIGASILVYLIALRLFGSGAPDFIPLFAALLFAVHPIQTDAVSYVSNRSDVLAAFFCLLALHVFLSSRLNRWKTAAIAACFILGLASKEIAAPLPALLLLADYFFVSGRNTHDMRSRRNLHATLWLILGANVGIRHVFLGQIGFGGRHLEDSWTHLSYFRTQIYVVMEYARLLILPFGLSLDHLVFPIESWKTPGLLRALGFWALILPACAAFIALIKKRGGDENLPAPKWTLFTFSIAWFFIALSTTSSFLPIFDAMVERRLYLPGFGFCLGAAALLLWAQARFARLTLALAAVCVAALGTLTFHRNTLYADPALLWEDVIAQYPDNPRAHNNLGIILSRKGDHVRSLESIRRAVELRPDNPDYLTNLGSVYFHLGDKRNAFAAFERCLSLQPRDPIAHYNLGNIFYSAADYPRAQAFYEKAVEMDPRHAESWGNLGVLSYKKGDLAKAVELFDRSLSLNPDNPVPLNWLGRIAQDQKKHGEAMAYYQKAIHLLPEYAEAIGNLADWHLENGEAAKAEDLFRKALEIKPSLTDAVAGLGRAFYSQGKYDPAMDCFLKVIEDRPHEAGSYHNLGAVFFQKGDEKKALECYRKAVSLRPDFAPAYNDIGIVLMNQKNYREAEKYFHIASDMDPKFALAWENLGDLYETTNRKPQAIRAYEKCLELQAGRADIAAKISRLKPSPKG